LAVSITKVSMVCCAQIEIPVVPSQVVSQDSQFNGPPYILYLLVMPKSNGCSRWKVNVLNCTCWELQVPRVVLYDIMKGSSHHPLMVLVTTFMLCNH
jgi:hypothetical protein